MLNDKGLGKHQRQFLDAVVLYLKNNGVKTVKVKSSLKAQEKRLMNSLSKRGLIIYDSIDDDYAYVRLTLPAELEYLYGIK